ncbi:MAG: hypothetical protein ACRCUF_05080, partial [Aeromonas sobria]
IGQQFVNDLGGFVAPLLHIQTHVASRRYHCGKAYSQSGFGSMRLSDGAAIFHEIGSVYMPRNHS